MLHKFPIIRLYQQAEQIVIPLRSMAATDWQLFTTVAPETRSTIKSDSAHSYSLSTLSRSFVVTEIEVIKQQG